MKASTALLISVIALASISPVAIRWASAEPDPDGHKVTVQEAESELSSLALQAPTVARETGGLKEFCSENAADVPMCFISAKRVDTDSRDVGAEPTVVGNSVSANGVILFTRLNDGAGRSWQSFIEFVWQDGHVKAVDPIYWSERHYDASTISDVTTPQEAQRS